MSKEDMGVPPSGSGHSAEPEPAICVAVSAAVAASVPNAGAFTPGPWRASGCVVEAITDGKPGVVVRGEIAKVFYVTSADGDANANLITAAPDLYEACAAWIEWLKPAEPWREDAADYEEQMLDAMRAALARACGEQP